MLQTITRNAAMESAQVRQELYLRRKYEKAQQDVGLFYYLYFRLNQSIEIKYGGIKSIRYIKAIDPAVMIP